MVNAAGMAAKRALNPKIIMAGATSSASTVKVNDTSGPKTHEIEEFDA